MTEIKIKRAYDQALDRDGYRIYIDRLWPRGLSHETFHYDEWAKDVAPSNELREWFHVDAENRWPEFIDLYEAELKKNPAWPKLRAEIESKPVVTLVYSSHDPLHNNAVVVKQMLDNH